MMPLWAPSISKYGSLVRPDAQIVALRAHCALHCARTALEAPPMNELSSARPNTEEGALRGAQSYKAYVSSRFGSPLHGVPNPTIQSFGDLNTMITLSLDGHNMLSGHP